MRFDLIDLRLFRQVVEAGSITGGAARAHLALAAASARIRGLEQTLGVPLLLRERRGVRPTAAGEALLRHARAVLQQVELLQGELAAFSGGLRGLIRLQCNGAAAADHLPEPLGRFLTAHPDIDVALEERPSPAVARALHEGRADLGILSDWAEPLGLETHLFRRDRLVLLAPRGHALAGRRSLSFAEALGEPFVGLDEGSALQEHLAFQAARLGRPLQLRARLRSAEALCRLVAAGAGLAVLPAAAARRPGLPLVALRLADPWAERRLLLCCRGPEVLPPQARLLWEFLRG